MVEHDKIDISEGIDISKANASKGCDICHYWYFLDKKFTARLIQVNLVTKADFNDKLKSLNQKINSNVTKHLLAENELKRLQTFNSIYFRGKSHFEVDDAQNYLVFQPMYGQCKSPSASHNFLNHSLNYLGTKTRVRFSGSYLKQDKIIYNHGKILNIVHEKIKTTTQEVIQH